MFPVNCCFEFSHNPIIIILYAAYVRLFCLAGSLRRIPRSSISLCGISVRVLFLFASVWRSLHPPPRLLCVWISYHFAPFLAVLHVRTGPSLRFCIGRPEAVFVGGGDSHRGGTQQTINRRPQSVTLPLSLVVRLLWACVLPLVLFLL